MRVRSWGLLGGLDKFSEGIANLIGDALLSRFHTDEKVSKGLGGQPLML